MAMVYIFMKFLLLLAVFGNPVQSKPNTLMSYGYAAKNLLAQRSPPYKIEYILESQNIFDILAVHRGLEDLATKGTNKVQIRPPLEITLPFEELMKVYEDHQTWKEIPSTTAVDFTLHLIERIFVFVILFPLYFGVIFKAFESDCTSISDVRSGGDIPIIRGKEGATPAKNDLGTQSSKFDSGFASEISATSDGGVLLIQNASSKKDGASASGLSATSDGGVLLSQNVPVAASSKKNGPSASGISVTSDGGVLLSQNAPVATASKKDGASASGNGGISLSANATPPTDAFSHAMISSSGKNRTKLEQVTADNRDQSATKPTIPSAGKLVELGLHKHEHIRLPEAKSIQSGDKGGIPLSLSIRKQHNVEASDEVVFFGRAARHSASDSKEHDSATGGGVALMKNAAASHDASLSEAQKSPPPEGGVALNQGAADHHARISNNHKSSATGGVALNGGVACSGERNHQPTKYVTTIPDERLKLNRNREPTDETRNQAGNKIKYSFVTELGSGGEGHVCLYRHNERPSQLCAIKLIKKVEGYKTKEADSELVRLLRRYPERYVIMDQELDLGPNSDWYALRFAYYKGGDLASYLERTFTDKPVPEDFIWHFFRQCSWILEFLHEGKVDGKTVSSHIPITHGDLKPANFLVEDVSSGKSYPNIKLADFGCYAQDLSKKSRGDVGTRDYIPPEWEIMYGPTHDMFAMGVMVHQMAWNEYPWHPNIKLSPQWNSEDVHQRYMKIRKLAIRPLMEKKYSHLLNEHMYWALTHYTQRATAGQFSASLREIFLRGLEMAPNGGS